MRRTKLLALSVLAALAIPAAGARPPAQARPTTPIQHLVVIFQENVSFDHYFGTYPHAANPVGEPRFVAAEGTPAVDGLTPDLLQHNPNLANPFRFDRSELFPCDQLHDYSLEQKAFDGGAMDRFVEFTGTPDPRCDRQQVMDGHPGNSDPLDEQTYLVETINRLEQSAFWRSTAIVVAYDDSDGWYDHAFPGVREASADLLYDGVTGPGACGTPAPGAYPDRCGLGPRLPLLVVSPYARTNYVSHVLLEQASILRFVEDNWALGRLGDQSFDARAASLSDLFDFRKRSGGLLVLDPATGEPAR